MTFSSTVSKMQLLIDTVNTHLSAEEQKRNTTMMEFVMKMIDCKEVGVSRTNEG